MMFKMQGKFVRKREVDKLNTCSGMAVKEKVVKRVEMVDIIAEREKTICKALTMYKDKLYVVDNGLDCVYTLFHEDGRISPRSLAALGGVVCRQLSWMTRATVSSPTPGTTGCSSSVVSGSSLDL